jgi:hypothetical protein
VATLGGGGDLDWLAPLDDEGNKDYSHTSMEGARGCHTGSTEGLNIGNPKEGYVYVHERNKGVDLARALREGGEIVQADDQELSGFSEILDSLAPTALDSAHIHKDVVMVRYPEEAVRKKREQEQQRARSMMREGAQDYVDGANSTGEGIFSQGLASRFKRRDHRIDYVDAHGDVVDSWTPDRGIIDEG